MNLSFSRIIISTAILLLASSSYSQNQSSIGLHITNSPIERLITDFKIDITDKYSIVAGFSVGWDNDIRYGEVIAWTNEVRMRRKSTIFDKSVNLRFGVSRQLRESHFSIGLNATGGFTRSSRYTFNTGRYFNNESSRWVIIGIGNKPTIDFNIEEYTSDITLLKVNFLRVGLSPSISAEIPINPQLNFQTFTGMYGGLKSNLGADSSESPNPINEPASLTFTTIEFYFQIGAGLYYNLGSKKARLKN
jgi:hypothetical protein